jgi:hypothetical protein
VHNAPSSSTPNRNGLHRFEIVSLSLILILNPFDRRCVKWDMAADFTTPADAQQLSKLFFPTTSVIGPLLVQCGP